MFLTQAVKIGLEGDNAIQQHGKSNWWLPIKWSISIVKNAMTEERVAHPPSYAALVKTEAEDGEDSLTLLYTVKPGVCDQVKAVFNCVGSLNLPSSCRGFDKID